MPSKELRRRPFYRRCAIYLHALSRLRLYELHISRVHIGIVVAEASKCVDILCSGVHFGHDKRHTCAAVMVSLGTLPSVWNRIQSAEADAIPSPSATASSVGCLWALAWL